MNLTETIQTGPVGAEDGNLAYEAGPDWFRTRENTGLIGFRDRNDDGRIQYYELEVDPDITVLANPEIAQLPNWMIAVVAAARSTAAGRLLVISAAFSHDLLESTFARNLSEHGALLAGRCAAAVAVCLAGCLGHDPPGFVAQVVAFAFGLAAASLFPAIVLGVLTRRVNREGAISGMLTGLIFTLTCIIWFKGVFIEPMAENLAENRLFGVSPEGIGALGMMLNFAVALSVSACTTPPPAEVREMVERIRLPRRGGRRSITETARGSDSVVRTRSRTETR